MANDPLNLTDPTGRCYKSDEVCNYDETETRSLLTLAHNEATAGPNAGLANIRNNMAMGRDFDFLSGSTKDDTWTFEGTEMNASEMGNFMAGFMGGSYDKEFGGVGARTGVIIAGIADSFVEGDTDFDARSRPHILAGMEAARGFEPSQPPTPGSDLDPHTERGRGLIYKDESDFRHRNPRVLGDPLMAPIP